MAKKKKTKKKWGKIGPPKSAKRKQWLASIRRKQQRLAFSSVAVRTEKYRAEHRKIPAGHGYWFFQIGSPVVTARGTRRARKFTYTGNFADGKRFALKVAQKANVDHVTVLP